MLTNLPSSPRASRATRPTARRARRLAAVGVTGMLVLSACATEDDDAGTADTAGTTDTPAAADDTGTTGPIATATVADADDNNVGTAEVVAPDGDGSGTTEISVDFSGLEPGMYGMHLHAVGVCETDSVEPDDEGDDDAETGDFLSAGGHLGANGDDHPDHSGDLPALLVNDDGEGRMTVATDRISAEDLLDDDGAALIIHENPDNYGNIPERYAPDGPDEETLSTGDAGDRQACGVFEAP